MTLNLVIKPIPIIPNKKPFILRLEPPQIVKSILPVTPAKPAAEDILLEL